MTLNRNYLIELNGLNFSRLVRKCLPGSHKPGLAGREHALYDGRAGFRPPSLISAPADRRAQTFRDATLLKDLHDIFGNGLAGKRIRLAKGDDDRRNKGDDGTGTAVITRTKPQTKRPNLYRVLLLNDDYTPMEFVVHVLERFFNKQREDATRIMLHVHQNGVGECGTFTYEVAETKVTQVMDFARKHQHPLQCVMEKK
jgi:ATP-dependent Clp protease adaptor protein ClpS